MKKSTKIVRLSVALLLLVAMLLTPMSPVFAVVIENGDADLTAADIVSEDASKREKFSRHYLTGDGTYFAVSYAEQVNYQDEDGNWIAVDNSLSTNVLTGEKTTKNDKFKVKFANKANKDDLVTIKTKEYEVSFGITVSEDGESYLELNKVIGTENPGNTSAEPKTTQEATSLGKAVSGITYFDAFSDYLDVRYSVAHEKVKEDLILERKSGFNSYKVTYNIKEKDALATLNDDGSITFTSPDGAVLFNVGVPVMYDSEGKTSADIAVSMTQDKKTVEVTYTPSADWLNAEERVYPVTIDPTVQTGTYYWNYYETVLSYSSAPYEILQSSNNINTVYQDQSLYLFIEFLPTIQSGWDVMGIDLVMHVPSAQNYTSNDEFVINRLTSYWMPGYLVNADGSTNLPSVASSPIEIAVYEALDETSTVLTVPIPRSFGTSYTYSSYLSGYGFEITMSSGYFNVYSCTHPTQSLRPVLAVRYSGSETVQLNTEGLYRIINNGTTNCLSVNGSEPVDNNDMLSLSGYNNSQMQVFQIQYYALSGIYRIKSNALSNDNLSKYLQSSYSNENDTASDRTAYVHYLTFDWVITQRADDNLDDDIDNSGYEIRIGNSPNAVLSVNSNGTVITTECNSADNKQLWEFIEVDQYDATESNPIYFKKDRVIFPSEASVPNSSWSSSNSDVASVDNYGIITTHRTGKCTITTPYNTQITVNVLFKNNQYLLKNSGNEKYLQSDFELHASDGGDDQVWDIYYIGNGLYNIKHNFLLLSSNSSGDGVELVSSGESTIRAQWYIEQTENRTFKIYNQSSSKVLTINGNGILDYDTYSSSDDEWYLYSAWLDTWNAEPLPNNPDGITEYTEVGYWKTSPNIYLSVDEGLNEDYYLGLLTSAVNKWNSALGINMTIGSTAGSNTIELYVTTVENYTRISGIAPNEIALGATLPHKNIEKKISRGQDLKNVYAIDSAEIGIFTWIDTKRKTLIREEDLEKISIIEEEIILHEIGHALGYLDHSNSEDDIMFPTYRTFDDLNPRDITQINQFYDELKIYFEY